MNYFGSLFTMDHLIFYFDYNDFAPCGMLGLAVVGFEIMSKRVFGVFLIFEIAKTIDDSVYLDNDKIKKHIIS